MNTTDVLAILMLIGAVGVYLTTPNGLGSQKGGRHTKKHHNSNKKTRKHR